MGRFNTIKKNLLRYVNKCNTQAVSALLELLDSNEIRELDQEISDEISYSILNIEKNGVHKYYRYDDGEHEDVFDEWGEYIEPEIIITKEEFYEFFKFLVTKSRFICRDKNCLKRICKLYLVPYDDSESAYWMFKYVYFNPEDGISPPF